MPESNRKQADMPLGAKIITNPLGTAPGYELILRPDTAIFALPGVPAELQAMLPEVIRRITQRFGVSELAPPRDIFTFGVSESSLSDALSPLYPLPDGVSLAYQATYPEVRLRIGGQNGQKQEIDQLETRILSVLRPTCPFVEKASLYDVFITNLLQKNITIALAESCTGGLFSSLITTRPGISAVFRSAFITYSNEAKIQTLEVSEKTIRTHGAVSQQTAEEMVKGLKDKTQADLCVSITGIAGPDGGTDEKPVGTVYIGIAFRKTLKVIALALKGNREQIRQQCVYHAMAQSLHLITPSA